MFCIVLRWYYDAYAVVVICLFCCLFVTEKKYRNEHKYNVLYIYVLGIKISKYGH